MTQRALFSLLFLLASFGFIQAQDKLLTIEDATSRNPKLFPSSLSQWQWFGTNNRYVYVAANALVAGNPTSTVKDTLVRLTQINEKLAASKGESLKRFPSITVVGNQQFYFTSGTTLWLYDLEKSALTSLNTYPKEVDNVDIEGGNYAVAYTKTNNL